MTSIDVDKGLSRQLPPADNTPKEEITDIKKSNVMRLEITAGSKLTVDGKPEGTEHLRSKIMTFVGKTADRHRHVIILDVDRNATYDAYFHVQNEIVAAYNALRDGYARRVYGRPYAQCTPEERGKVREYYPQRVAETGDISREGGGV